MSRYRADKELAQVALARAAQSISVSPIFVLAEVQFNNVPLFVCLQRSKRIAFDMAANDKHSGISDCLTNGLIIAVQRFFLPSAAGSSLM